MPTEGRAYAKVLGQKYDRWKQVWLVLGKRSVWLEYRQQVGSREGASRGVGEGGRDTDGLQKTPRLPGGILVLRASMFRRESLSHWFSDKGKFILWGHGPTTGETSMVVMTWGGYYWH